MDSNLELPQKTSRRRKSRSGLSLKQVNLDHVQKKLLNVLLRDTNALLLESTRGKLNKDDAQSLNNYLKLIKDLKKVEDEDLNGLSDEELEKLANVAK